MANCKIEIQVECGTGGMATWEVPGDPEAATIEGQSLLTLHTEALAIVDDLRGLDEEWETTRFRLVSTDADGSVYREIV